MKKIHLFLTFLLKFASTHAQEENELPLCPEDIKPNSPHNLTNPPIIIGLHSIDEGNNYCVRGMFSRIHNLT